MKRLWPFHARFGFTNGLLTIITPQRKHIYCGVIFVGIRHWLPHFVIGAFDIQELPAEPPYYIKARTLGFGGSDSDHGFHRIHRVEFTVA